MKKKSRAAILLLCLITTGLWAAPADKVVTYQIDAHLDTETKTITGAEVLTWTNTGAIPTAELYFHLYWNAFKNSRSTLLTEAARRETKMPGYLKRFQENGWGYCDVKSMRAAGDGLFAETSLTPVFVQPDGGSPADETVFKVDLPAPVPPGASIMLNIDFIAQVPHNAPRTGYHQDYFFIAQWFPKIGVFIDDQWNCHEFHANTEYFADFGDYDVSLTVPANFVVGASGVMTDSTTSAGQTTYRFQQENIHDFAWTAWPGYRIATRKFESPDLPAVTMRLLYQPEHQRYVDDFFGATANTLKYFGGWYVPYSYRQVTIVDAGWRTFTAGMEYPTIFTVDADWLSAAGRQDPLSITVHECGHQFFYGMIASNEFEDAWLDEGIDTYATARCLNTAYGPGAFCKSYLAREGFGLPKTFAGVTKDPRDWIVETFRTRGTRDVIDKKSWQYVDRAAYRNNSYEKPALMLWTLEGYLGETVWAEIMRTYSQRWAFRHPKPQDFIDVVNEIAPQNMDWFFNRTMNEPGVVDYAVRTIVSNQQTAELGYFGAGDDKTLKKDKPEKAPFESQVHVERLGALQIPVELRVTFENGETETLEWDGAELYKIFYFTHDAKIEKAELDPFHKIWLDVNQANNGKYREANRFAAVRWGAKWLFWLQDLLEMVAVFS